MDYEIICLQKKKGIFFTKMQKRHGLQHAFQKIAKEKQARKNPTSRKLAGLTGLEPATFRVTGGRSNQTELQPLWLPGQDSNLRPND